MERGKKKSEGWIAVLVGCGLVGSTVLFTACVNSAPPHPCQVHPTKMNSAGEWVEWDDEPMDADPCDADDVKVKVKITTGKPKPVTTFKTSQSVPSIRRKP